MSLTLIKSIFEHLPDCHNWSAHLLSFHHSKRHESTYNCRIIELEPQNRLFSLIQEISNSYSGNTKNHLLWVSIIALVVLGLLGMYFVGPYEAARHHFEPNIFFNKFWPFVLIGTVIMFAFSKLSKKWVIRISWVLGIMGLLLMLKTIIHPTLILGSARWVNIGPAYIDPFMMSLPAYIDLMSHWLSKEKKNKTWTTIGTSALTLFIICEHLVGITTSTVFRFISFSSYFGLRSLCIRGLIV